MRNLFENELEDSQNTNSNLANYIRRSLFKNHELDSKNITIQVVNGRVFIEGTVTSPRNKNEIERFVSDLTGVGVVSSYITCKKSA